MECVMNISFYPIQNLQSNNISFGMAKFTDKGYQLAKLHSDIYDSLKEPNTTLNPEFFKKPSLLGKAPFTKYFIAKTSVNNRQSTMEVAQTIIDCAATNNQFANSCFIQQLLATEKQIHSSSDETKQIIGKAINDVFKKNWDNPELSQKDTFRLLELAKYGMNDKAYISHNGVLVASESK